MNKRNLVLLFLLSICTPLPAHAYAGPGVAIGAVIVFITVIFAFFASLFISASETLKKLARKISLQLKRNHKSKNK